MKKFLMLLLVLFAGGVFAAEVPDSLLTETQRQKLQLIDTKAKVETRRATSDSERRSALQSTTQCPRSPIKATAPPTPTSGDS